MRYTQRMSIDRRNFIKLLGTSLLLSACRTGPLPLPTPAPTAEPPTPPPTSTPLPTATATGTATTIPPTPLPGTPISTPIPPTATRLPATPPPAATPVALATRVSTVNDFYVQTYSGEPDPRADAWALRVEGLVDTPATFRLADIKALPAASQMRTLECIGNPVGGNQIGNINWKGALFTALMEKVGVKPQASWVAIHGDDGYFTSLPLAKLNSRSPHARWSSCARAKTPA